ncbi:MAG: hypothetical protein AABX01_06435 [Candidatus Micrarchaeota archaeon]
MMEPELRSKPIIASDRLLDIRLSRVRTINELVKNANRYRRGGDAQAIPLSKSLQRLIMVGRHTSPEGWLVGKLLQGRKLTPGNWNGLIRRYFRMGGSADSLNHFTIRATKALRFSGQYVERFTFDIPTIEMADFRHTVNGAVTFVNGRLMRAHYTAQQLIRKEKR